MATTNPFDILGDDNNDDPSQLLAAQQQKSPVTSAPMVKKGPAQAQPNLLAKSQPQAGKRFYAHRICLLASSDTFRAMFDGGYGVQYVECRCYHFGVDSRITKCERSGRSDVFFEADSGDAIEAHEWKCMRTINDSYCTSYGTAVSIKGC